MTSFFAMILLWAVSCASAQKTDAPYPVGLLVEFSKLIPEKKRDELHASFKMKLKHRFAGKSLDSVTPLTRGKPADMASFEALCKQYLKHKEVVHCDVSQQMVLH